MNRFVKSLLCAFLCAILITLCGCKSEGTDSTIFADIGEKIVTLDPQLATGESEITIVHNIFEGLTRLNDKGEATLALAERYEKDGNTYTFYLKDKLLWNDGTPLTAHDFVFSLRRAASADTAAPDFQYIACIKGADAVRNGADSKTLAVSAPDDKTLKITLLYDDGKLLYYLSKPICMPCNEEFFRATNGKYGRDKESVLCNGPFRLRTWTTENYAVRLKRNENYSGTATVPAAVYITNNDYDTLIEKMADNKLNFSLIKSAHYEKLADKGLKIDKYFNKCWFVVINKNSVLGEPDIRKALCLSLSREGIKNSLPPYTSLLDAYIPQKSLFSEENIYDSVLNKYTLPFDAATGYSLYSSAVIKQQSQEPLSIIYPENEGLDSAVTSVASAWQENLGCFINITPYTSNESVLNSVKSGNFTVAVIGIDAGNNDAFEFLSTFAETLKIENKTFNSSLSALRTKKSAEEYAAAVAEIEKTLWSDNTVLPIVTTPTMLCYENNIKDVFYNTQNGYVDFTRFIKK